MTKIGFRILMVALLVTTVAFAQPFMGQGGPGRGPGNNTPNTPGMGPGNNALLDMTRLQMVEGRISNVQFTCRVQCPSIVVDRKLIKVAPAWYLLENDFELSVGAQVKVLAAPSRLSADPYLYAVEITKTASGASLTLRDQTGLPLWGKAGRRSMVPVVPRLCGGCVDPATIGAVTGTIYSTGFGPGIQHPTLTLKAGNTLMVFDLGPERVLLESGLELEVGSTLTVRYGVDSFTHEYLALQLTDATGITVVLRHDDGTPAWNN